MIEPNYSYRAVSGDLAEKELSNNLCPINNMGFTVPESNGSVLVDATDFLLRDALQVSTTLQNKKQGSYTIDATRSAMYLQRTKLPLNTEFETTVTFVNRDGKPGNYVTVTPVPEAITLRMHSFYNCLTIILRQDYMMSLSIHYQFLF
jgi:hypothetical protein